MISIIVPFFNSEQYIKECIESVKNQTFKNWELLLIDDGSTDRSNSLIAQYVEKDNRLKIFHQENQGVSAARNKGIDESKGDYIFFLDSDDCIFPETLNDLYNIALKTQGEIIIGQRVNFDSNFRQVKGKIKEFNRNRALKMFLNFRLISGYVTGKLYKKSLIKETRFNTAMTYGEDGTFFFDLLLKISKLVYTTEPSYKYRIRNNSLTGRNEDYGNKNLDVFKQIENIKSKLPNWQIWVIVFQFEIFRQELDIYTHTTSRATKQKYVYEYNTLRKFCNKYWIKVVINSSNPRVKYHALKYGFNNLRSNLQ